MPETMISYFMKTRKGEGKHQARVIINFLQKYYSDKQGWVRARDIVQNLVREGIIPEGPALFRILKDLESVHIIERREEIIPSSRSKPNKKKPSVFYRMSHTAYIDRVLTSQERDSVEHSMKVRLHEQQFDLTVAKKVLENHGLLEEYEKMKDDDEFANYRKFIEEYRATV
ncbi:MAG: hypothetical protein ABSE07_06340 [Methanoregula sp.]